MEQPPSTTPLSTTAICAFTCSLKVSTVTKLWQRRALSPGQELGLDKENKERKEFVSACKEVGQRSLILRTDTIYRFRRSCPRIGYSALGNWMANLMNLHSNT